MVKQYDAIIIGSGQGGTPLSIRLAKAGYKTALVEKKWVGGTCINNGCIPSKTIIAGARTEQRIAEASRSEMYTTDNYDIIFEKVIERKNAVVERFRKGSERSVNETEGLDLIYGKAIFTQEKEIEVHTNTGENLQLTAPLIFINTGARPAIPDIKGIEDVPYLTSTEIMELDKLPEHLLILGAGYISLELGQAFRRMGSRVTIVEAEDNILAKEDTDVQKEMTEILEKESITILTNTEVEELSLSSKNEIVAHIVKNETKALITASHILIATGRKPNTDNIKLSGVAIDEGGYVKVNDRLETNVEGTYAIGDVKGGMAFTHVAYNDYRIIYSNLVEKKERSTANRLIPYCMFTDPELGRVGMTEAEAKSQGLNYTVAKLPMKKAARAIVENKMEGFMKAIVDKDSKKILGASFLCLNAGEIISVLQMAMEAGFSYEDVKEQMFAHPTLSESLNNLFFLID